MRKLAFALGIFASSWAMAQYYPNYGWGGNYEYVSEYDYEDFPDDYYYEYPADYYDETYYRSLYNDYRKSISMVNWNVFFRQHRLNSSQINLIIELNRQFPSYTSWSARYRMNPKRWWYDRFYALERILGAKIFIVFQNNYYHGYSPIRYYDDYWRDNYYPHYPIMPKYRRVNVERYRINRDDYYRNHQNSYSGNQWRETQQAPRTGGFRTSPIETPSNTHSGGFRSGGNPSSNGNIRSGGFGQGANENPRSGSTNNSNTRTGGFR